MDENQNSSLFAPPRAFMTALILSGIDFPNIKQYSSSK